MPEWKIHLLENSVSRLNKEIESLKEENQKLKDKLNQLIEMYLEHGHTTKNEYDPSHVDNRDIDLLR